MYENTNLLAARFAALGDTTRLAIVNRLMTEGPASAGELSGLADISAPAMSRHLRVLREAGLVRRESDAQRRIYSVEPEALRAIAAWSIRPEEFWGQSLDRLAILFSEKWKDT